jgi:cell wall-associated NlpC family hydrolase
MALGQNEQFFYSPDVRIFINSLTQGGIIEVSDDFMSLTIDRNINAVSTASIYLANNGFKYTPASTNFSASKVPSPVINTMDQIIIFLKKESYYQYFTGFVTYAPIVTIIPEPILINCSCTLYKAQNSYWDAGAIEYEGIIPGILQNAQIFGGNVQNNDGGVATGITNLLTKVANWASKDIHIGGIPSQWVSFATDIYKQTQIQLKDVNATSFEDIINYLEVTGNSSKSVTDTTTKGKTGVGDSTVSSLGVKGAPIGTALRGITTGKTITATFATTKEMNDYATKGTSSSHEADIIVSNANDNQYWVAVPFTYWASDVGDQTHAKEWLRGGGLKTDPDIYPAAAQIGRLLLITNTKTGHAIQAHAVYAIKDDLQLNGSKIILSEASFTSLGGSVSSSSDILNDISVDGWVNPSARSLIGGPVTTTKPLSSKSSTNSSPSIVKQDGSYPTWQQNLLNPTLPNSNSSAAAQISANDKKGTKGQEAASWAASQIGGAYVWGGGHEGAVGSGPTHGVTGDTQDPNAKNEIGFDCSGLVGWAWIKCGSEFDGLFGDTGEQLNSNVGQRIAGVGPINPDLLEPGDLIFYGGSTAHPTHVVMYSNWPGYVVDAEDHADGIVKQAFYQSTPDFPIVGVRRPSPSKQIVNYSINVGVGGGAGSTKGQPGLSNVGGNFNFNTTQGVIGFDVNSTVLAGSPRAFVTDVPVLSTIGTLSTMGLREFQSGPDGSFLAWYPDYFGLYGTAPVLSIYDIEIIDFSIYHDDTQLYTHIGVSGDPTEVGDVSLVDWLMTNGIITIENNAVLGLLFGTDPATMSTSMNSLISQGININTFAKQFLKRYGMRPYVDSEPMIRSQLMEFMYALQEFLYLWSQQYATNVTFTFMPELYPGMLINIAEHGIQVYVQAVSQSCSRDGGFTTSAVVTCPTRIVGKKKVNGKLVNNVVPLDFGYPIQLQNG